MLRSQWQRRKPVWNQTRDLLVGRTSFLLCHQKSERAAIETFWLCRPVYLSRNEEAWLDLTWNQQVLPLVRTAEKTWCCEGKWGSELVSLPALRPSLFVFFSFLFVCFLFLVLFKTDRRIFNSDRISLICKFVYTNLNTYVFLGRGYEFLILVRQDVCGLCPYILPDLSLRWRCLQSSTSPF